MALALIQPSFSSGELAPQLFGRVDLAKYKVGTALMRNFFVDYRGGATNRAGSLFCGREATPPTGDQPRLIPFIVDTSQTYALLFGHEYIRFYSNGAQVLNTATTITGITNANPAVVTDTAHGYTTGVEIVISGVGGMVEVNEHNNYLIVRIDANSYSLTDLDGNDTNSSAWGAYTSGGVAQSVVQVTTPYSGADLPLLKYVQSADVLTLTHPLYPIYNLTRTGAVSFTLAAEVIGPTQASPTSLTTTYTGGSGSNFIYGYVVTAVSGGTNPEESLATLPSILNCPTLDGINNMALLKWAAPSSGVIDHYNIYKWGKIRNDTPAASVFGYIGQSLTTNFTDNDFAPDFTKPPPQYGDPFSPQQVTSLAVLTSGTFASNTWVVPLVFSGGGGSGAKGYAIIDPNGWHAIGAVVTSTGKGYSSAPTVTAPAGGGHTDATFTPTISAASGNWPSCVTYFQQRRTFGGTLNAPESLVFSQPGDYHNFNTTPVSAPSDAITVSIASRQVNVIKSMTPMSTGLVTLTTGGGFLLSGGVGTAAITPSDISALPQASPGANDLPPLPINYNILYMTNRGSTVRDLAFQFYIQSYVGTDRSVLSSHLFQCHTFNDWAYAEEPYRLVWATRDDGVLLSMAYVPDQEVAGWSHHDTNGLYRSVCAIPEGNTNGVYTVVQRYVNTEPVWYVERFADRTCGCCDAPWFVDAALAHTSPAQDSSLVITQTSPATVLLKGSAPGYNMTAEENFSPDITAQLSSANLLYANTSQSLVGQSYDYVNRKITYILHLLRTDNQTNTTGFTLWDGVQSFAPNASLLNNSGFYACGVYLVQKDIDAGTVVSYPLYDSTSTVPNGIGGSDGTWRRTTIDFSFDSNNPVVIDPRTGNAWVSAQSCDVYLLQASDNFKQQISPFTPPHTTANDLGIVMGVTENWAYAYTQHAGGTTTNLYLFPLDITAPEVAADYILAYGTYTFPVNYTTQIFKYTIAQDTSTYLFTRSQSGTRNYKLYQFTEPSSIPYPSLPVGGGFTDITPWSGSTGPNSDESGYTTADCTASLQYEDVFFSLPATGQLVALSIYSSTAHGDGSYNPANYKIGCTYVTLSGPSFDYHSAFVTGYMSAAWTPTTSGAAVWAPFMVRTLNDYMQASDYSYPSDDYTTRWLYFSCYKVNAGTVDATVAYVVMVQYTFVSGSVPTVVQVVDETPWDAGYVAYSGSIYLDGAVWSAPAQKAVVFQSMEWSFPFGAENNENRGNDSGLYDSTNNVFWWSGMRATPHNVVRFGQIGLFALNPAFAPRALQGDPTSVPSDTPNIGVTTPLLRLGFTEAIQGIVQVGCGFAITNGEGTLGAQSADVLFPFDFGTMTNAAGQPLLLVDSGEWSLGTPVSTVTGLDHLDGLTVTGVADGLVIPPTVVVDGALTLANPASNIIVGLGYTAQLQTLRLDTGDPTIQGKRKLTSAVTLRLISTSGLKAGRTFSSLVPIKECVNKYGECAFSGDARTIMDTQWEKTGQLCFQQDAPLPASIIADIPEVTVGDTER